MKIHFCCIFSSKCLVEISPKQLFQLPPPPLLYFYPGRKRKKRWGICLCWESSANPGCPRFWAMQHIYVHTHRANIWQVSHPSSHGSLVDLYSGSGSYPQQGFESGSERLTTGTFMYGKKVKVLYLCKYSRYRYRIEAGTRFLESL
jgi:hypothetical protein